MRLTFFFIACFLFFHTVVQAQAISGTITDSAGQFLQDVHVQTSDGQVFTISDPLGNFQLNIDTSLTNEISLRFSRIGYETKEVWLNKRELSENPLLVTLLAETYKSEMVVVTASRTLRDIEEVTIPVKVVGKEEISRTGSMRLSDILAEQTGMQVVSDHGTGIQVQGFDPDYTLIMIDGNPVIGRTAGTLELDRISVRNVEQIEIVKGPSSALWGSDALAGVVNIITQKSDQPVSGGLTTRYGENNTLDLAGDASLRTGNWSNNFFVNRNSSGGYRINPNSVARTVPEYENYTLNYRMDTELSDQVTFDASARYFTETQDNTSSITDENGGSQLLTSNASRKDFVVNPLLTIQSFERIDLVLNHQFSFYKTDSELTYTESGDLYEATDFNQYYNKPELQAGYRWNNRHHTIAGGGVIFERLEADRYPSQPGFTTQYIFTQHSWKPGNVLELTTGFRYDTHSEYRSQFSPKFSVRYNATDWLQLRGSVGRGFKAPEFRQLFLDFTNATAGYSVFGSSTVVEGIERLEEEGQISRQLISFDQLEEIKAESSIAANLGLDMDLFDQLRFRINLFRNNVTDLIETAPIAQKTNGQSVFTYFNLEEIHTQGAEAELQWTISSDVQASVGYQYLNAERKAEDERTVQNSEGEVITETITSYEPMFNRSAHSGNIKLFYENESGWGAAFRGVLRGRYGLYDSNGNGFVDGNEYENGYSIWNASVSKELFRRLTIQAGADNLFDYKNINVPSLPGRIWYAQVSMQF